MSSYQMKKELILKFLHDTFAYNDRGTWSHSLRVGEICSGIAGELDLIGREQANITVAGFLHDVGKVYMLDLINQPGQLAKGQREIVSNHPQFGSEIISSHWQHIPKDINMGIVLHHERLDGTGYPFNLKEEEVPMVARIVAVADVFDAMSTARPYRQPLPVQDIRKELNGSGYDQTVVQALERYLAQPVDPPSQLPK